RRAADAARLIEAVLEQAGMSGVRMLSALGTALIGTALARAELDRDAPRGSGPRHDRLEAVLLSHLRAARPYGLGSWEQTALRWARWAGLWSAGELRHALRRALDADRALKSSTLSDEAGILEQLVLPWGVRARRRRECRTGGRSGGRTDGRPRYRGPVRLSARPPVRPDGHRPRG